VIDWINERVYDYHRRARTLGGPRVLAGLVDVLAFAAQSKCVDCSCARVLGGRGLRVKVFAAGPQDQCD